MKKSRFTDSQILAILKQAKNGLPVTKFCHQHSMSNAASYKWRSKYGGMDASLMARMKGLEQENARLEKDVRRRSVTGRGRAGEALAKKW
jgi:Transposase.